MTLTRKANYVVVRRVTTRRDNGVRYHDDFGGCPMNGIYLSALDVVGITIALVTAISLIITSAMANARMTRQRNWWRDEALRLQGVMDSTRPTLKSDVR